jgi:hypothetical protein
LNDRRPLPLRQWQGKEQSGAAGFTNEGDGPEAKSLPNAVEKRNKTHTPGRGITEENLLTETSDNKHLPSLPEKTRSHRTKPDPDKAQRKRSPTGMRCAKSVGGGTLLAKLRAPPESKRPRMAEATENPTYT